MAYSDEDREILYHVPQPGGVDEQMGIVMLRVGKGTARPRYRRSMVSKDTYTLQLIVDGSGMIETHGRRLVISAGDTVVFWQGHPYEWWTHPKDLLSHYWVDFEGKAAHGIVRALPLSPTECVLPREAAPAEEIQCFEELVQVFREPGTAALLKSYALFFNIWRSVHASCAGPIEMENTATLAERAKRFIETHYVEDLGMREIARHVNVTPEYLSTVFRRRYGLPPYEYVIACRLEAAARLIQKGATVKEAAASVGYFDAGYFTRLFRSKRGITPGSLRR